MLFEDLQNNALMILDFNEIAEDMPDHKNIKKYFETCRQQGLNPKLAQQRQAFNDRFLEQEHVKYLIGRYQEDRVEMLRGSAIEKEGRTIHLGLDIFSKHTETVYTPQDGVVLHVGYEPQEFSYGNYIIIQYDGFCGFFGHMGPELSQVGTKLKAGDIIGRLGNHEENGGWSIHLHLQILKEFEKDPPGYSTKENLRDWAIKYPNPSEFFDVP